MLGGEAGRWRFWSRFFEDFHCFLPCFVTFFLFEWWLSVLCVLPYVCPLSCVFLTGPTHAYVIRTGRRLPDHHGIPEVTTLPKRHHAHLVVVDLKHGIFWSDDKRHQRAL